MGVKPVKRTKTKKKYKKQQQKQIKKNARIRSHTAPKPPEPCKGIFYEPLSRRQRANGRYASSQCPKSPSIPEENDDILAISNHQNMQNEDVSDQSTTGFSSDSDSTSTSEEYDQQKHGLLTLPCSPSMRMKSKSCNDLKSQQNDFSIIQRTATDEYDFELNEEEENVVQIS